MSQFLRFLLCFLSFTETVCSISQEVFQEEEENTETNVSLQSLNEPQHDKTNKMSVRPAKTQISLGVRPVWSVFAVHSMAR